MKIKDYPPEIEKRMRDFYNSLSEKDRRHAAVEATKSGHGGITYICHELVSKRPDLPQDKPDVLHKRQKNFAASEIYGFLQKFCKIRVF